MTPSTPARTRTAEPLLDLREMPATWSRRAKYDWPVVLDHAAAIVRSYETGVTLRQLFYRLVADGTISNTKADYDSLSEKTTSARRGVTRNGRPAPGSGFPKLIDPVTARQVEEYDLPQAMGKATDTRSKGFTARHGKLVQVELDALPPDLLRRLYQDQIDRLTDTAVVAASIAREHADRARLTPPEAVG